MKCIFGPQIEVGRNFIYIGMITANLFCALYKEKEKERIWQWRKFKQSSRGLRAVVAGSCREGEFARGWRCGVAGSREGHRGNLGGVTWSPGRHREGCAGGHKFEIEYLASPVATSSNPDPSHRASKPVAMIVDPDLYLLELRSRCSALPRRRIPTRVTNESSRRC